MMFIEIW